MTFNIIVIGCYWRTWMCSYYSTHIQRSNTDAAALRREETGLGWIFSLFSFFVSPGLRIWQTQLFLVCFIPFLFLMFGFVVQVPIRFFLYECDLCVLSLLTLDDLLYTVCCVSHNRPLSPATTPGLKEWLYFIFWLSVIGSTHTSFWCLHFNYQRDCSPCLILTSSSPTPCLCIWTHLQCSHHCLFLLEWSKRE